MTMTCDTVAVTDPDPDLDHLRAIVADLHRANQRVRDLERERNAEIVRVIGDHPPHGRIVATANAAGLSRQQVDVIRKRRPEL